MLLRGSLDALAEIAERTAPWDMGISVGLPLLVELLFIDGDADVERMVKEVKGMLPAVS